RQLHDAVVGSAPAKSGERLSCNTAAESAKRAHVISQERLQTPQLPEKRNESSYVKIMRKVGVVLLGPGVLVVGVSTANLNRTSSTETLDWQIMKQAAKQVNVESPTLGPIIQTVTAPGVVEPVEAARISSQVVGRVVQLCVEDGDLVKDGDLLLRLDEQD